MKLAIEGIIVKPSRKEKAWGVGIPLLEIYSQGDSKKNALYMIQKAVEEAIEKPGFKTKVTLTGDGTFALSADNFQTLLSLMLKQQRTSKGMSFREISKRLGSSSPNAYSRYEHGNSSTSLEKLAELIGASNTDKYLLLKTG